MPRAQNNGYSHLLFGHTYTEKADPAQFERHCHANYEMLYVLRGNGKYVVEGAEYPLKPHTLILIRPYEFHYVCPDKNCTYERYVINFDGNILIGAAAELSILQNDTQKKHGVYFSEEHLTAQIRAEFYGMDEARKLFAEKANRAAMEETMIRTALTRVLLLLSLADRTEGAEYEENVITRVTEYLDLHLTDNFSLDKIAQLFFVSKYYLCHAFREQNGTSIFAYLTVKRIAMAQRLLLSGEPATSVAYQVGFRNYSSFYRAYCKQTGKAPAHRRETNA
ncbi:MAG: AraC family transcriptional regulator [Clostridia bacterium]|nr:AraC family transcriptional regulator [Clostridia bacterium]